MALPADRRLIMVTAFVTVLCEALTALLTAVYCLVAPGCRMSGHLGTPRDTSGYVGLRRATSGQPFLFLAFFALKWLGYSGYGLASFQVLHDLWSPQRWSSARWWLGTVSLWRLKPGANPDVTRAFRSGRQGIFIWAFRLGKAYI